MRRFLSALLALCAGLPASRADAQWHRLPISEPESTTAVLDLPGRLLAGTGKGLMASDDGGTVWRAFGKGLSDAPITAFLEGPAGLIAMQGATMFTSTDRGAAWIRPEGKGAGDTLWSLEYRGDTLLALWGLFPPHPRSISFDAGRNWKPIDSTAWDAGDPVDSSGTGVRFRRHGGALLRSLDHGATWEPCPGMELYGDVTGFSVRSDAYAATRPGNLIRSQDSGSSWQVVAVGDRPATPSLIAAAGNDICYSSRLGIHCSGDFGESFRLLCPNPWPKDQLGMDLGNGKVYLFPKQVAHGQSVVVGEIRPGGSWRKFPFPGSNNEISGLGARDSTVLVLRTHWDSIMISRDYGGRFKTVASTVFRGFIGQPRLGRNLWAYPFGSIYYSSADQGKAWKASPFAPFTARENGFAVADSDVVCASGNGSLWRNRISDTGWKAMPLPAGDSAYSVAAADTVLYAAVRGAILRQPLYGTAVGLRRRKQARYPTQRPKGPALASPGRTPPPPRVDARGRLFP